LAEVYKVNQGECLSSISKKFGFKNWNALYDHPKNKSLKEKRPNPSLISPGDEIFIPDRQQKTESCEGKKKHVFVKKVPRVHFRVKLKDEQGDPFDKKKYILEVGGVKYEGTTDKGEVKEEIPADAERAKLSLWWNDDDPDEVHEWDLDLGHLDPIEEISGVQGRLKNLGYEIFRISGEIDTSTLHALKKFQSAYNLDATGELTDETRHKLKQIYGM